MAKAAQKAGQDFKAAVRAGSDTASDIFTGDDYDPVTPIDETAVPPAEPRLTPNQPQVRNAPPEGARPIAPPPSARSGGGRGSGGGGVMLKNRRLMAPQGVATPDYDFKLMQKGGSVEQGRKFYPWRTRESNPLPPPINEKIPGYVKTQPEDEFVPPSRQPSVKRGATLSFAKGGSVSRAGSDPQRSRREKGEANEEFDAEFKDQYPKKWFNYAKGGSANYGQDYRKKK